MQPKQHLWRLWTATLACCLMLASCAGKPPMLPALPMPTLPERVLPPPNLTTPPEALPQPTSGAMRELESNHRAVAQTYHLLAARYCQLLAFVQVPCKE